MMKKLIALFLVGLLLFCTGCNSQRTTPTSNSNSSSGSEEKVLVGVAMPTQSLQRWNQDGANMKKLLEEKRLQG